jgi:hypothetical protein
MVYYYGNEELLQILTYNVGVCSTTKGRFAMYHSPKVRASVPFARHSEIFIYCKISILLGYRMLKKRVTSSEGV